MSYFELDKKTGETLKKLFIGGLPEFTDDNGLQTYFGQYGEISDCVVIKDANKVSRKFGFVTFAEIAATNECIKQKPHTIDGKEVDVKRAIPRDLGNITRGKKAFIGGIPKDLTDEELTDMFHNCGLDLKVTEVLLIKDKLTNQNKGFGFVTFEEEDQVDKVATVRKFLLNNKQLEAKHAEPKNQDGSMGGGRGRGGMRGGRGGGRGRGGGQGYNQGGYDAGSWGNGNGYGGGGYEQSYDAGYGGGYGGGGGYDQGYNQGYDASYATDQYATQGYEQGGYQQGGYQQGGGRGGRGGYHPYKR